MAGFTDYEPTKSDGTLPNDETKGIFQYKRFIHWNTFELFAQGLGRIGRGTWHMQLIGPDGKVLFEQKVTIEVTVIFTGFSMIWYYYDDVGEKIETTIVAGNPVTEENLSWSYTLGNTDQSEFGTLLPGGGVVAYSSGTGAIMDADWQSPAYKMTVPVGSKLNVVTDHWGLGSSVRPEWRFRFGDANLQQIDSTFDDFGYLYSVNNADNSKGNLQCMLSLPRHAPRSQESLVTGSAPTMTVDRSGRVLMLKNDDGKWNLYQSLDSMLTWEKTESELLQGSVEMAHLVPLTGGGFVMITKNGSTFQYIRRGADGSQVKGNVPVTDSVTEMSASQDAAGIVWVINQEGLKIAVSHDDGATFEGA